MAEPIVIVAYDPQWAAMYEEEKARILDAIGEKVLAIEHIGSTAVPGLGAKPIIDMMAGIRSMSHSMDCIQPLEELGYEYFFYPEFPTRRFFRDGPMGEGPHHLHMTEYLSGFWREKLTFRDFLRTHHEVAQEYHKLKTEWADRFGADRERYEAYTEAKTSFIESVLARARTAG
jgi:GrpB-like predicted nucleotidyltransferase (UPF0157 family)